MREKLSHDIGPKWGRSYACLLSDPPAWEQPVKRARRTLKLQGKVACKNLNGGKMRGDLRNARGGRK
jgi:hypothetical protein